MTYIEDHARKLMTEKIEGRQRFYLLDKGLKFKRLGATHLEKYPAVFWEY